MESAWSVMRDKIDEALHREDQRVACDYSLVQSVDTFLKNTNGQTVWTFRCVHCLSTCILVFLDTVVPLVIMNLHS